MIKYLRFNAIKWGTKLYQREFAAKAAKKTFNKIDEAYDS